MSLTYGELFAGYGGLGLGVQSVLGGHMAWCAEIETAPSRILAHHWPDAPNLGDVTKVDWTQVQPVDVITGGSPCQDLSHAGKRAGMKAGTRSGLWASMCDAIDIIRPGLVVWENVRGALSAEADSAVEPCPLCVGDRPGPTLRALGRVLGDLAELGYDARWYGLRAADVGAPHGRFRIFLFATPGDASSRWDGQRTLSAGDRRGRPEPSPRNSDRDSGWEEHALGQLPLIPTPTANDYKGSTRTRQQAFVEGATLLPTPRTSDTNGAGAHGDGGPDLRTVATLLPTPTSADSKASGGSSPSDVTLTDAVVRTDLGGQENTRHLLPTPGAADGSGGHINRSGARSDELLLPGVARSLADETLLPTPRTGPNRTSRKALTMQQFSAPGLEQAIELAAGRLPREYESWDEVKGHAAQDWREYEPAIRRWEARTRPAPPPTEPGAKGQPRLSPAFVEWMMGLPLGHVTDPAIGITRNEQLKALGNGVVPQQAAAATRAFIHDHTQESAA